MINIHVKVIYGDHEIPWQDQEYHDGRIDAFKFKATWILKQARSYYSVEIEAAYYPQNRKFKITNIEPEKEKFRVEKLLSEDTQFRKEYLL